jgi:hypothetical protein
VEIINGTYVKLISYSPNGYWLVANNLTRFSIRPEAFK